jgi:hypothetical protein
VNPATRLRQPIEGIERGYQIHETTKVRRRLLQL